MDAPTDLSAILAPPPGSDWVERAPDVTQLVGPFTAHDYGVYVDDKGASEAALGRYGFVAGYERDWQQRVTQDYMFEIVWEFGVASGAGYWFSDLKLSDQTDKSYAGAIPTLTGSMSYGGKSNFTQGGHGYRIFFVKGNLAYGVEMDSQTNDLSAAVLTQAQAQYDMAPSSTSVPISISNSGSSAGNAAAIVFIAFIALGTVAFMVMSRRRRAITTSMQLGGFQMSPDGNYWWDGQRWRPVATDPPPIRPT